MDLDTAQLIALAGVLGFASGLRLYAVVLVIGVVGYFGWVDLPSGLQVLGHPWVIVAAASMAVIEFLADKVPAIDSLWDAVHTFIRIPAGAALAGAVFGFGSGDPTWSTVAAIVGGSFAATSHLAKTGTRAAVNTSPEPFSNAIVSTGEDVLVGGLLALVLLYPLAALAVVLVLIALALWLLPRLFRYAVSVLRRLTGSPAPGRAPGGMR